MIENHSKETVCFTKREAKLIREILYTDIQHSVSTMKRLGQFSDEFWRGQLVKKFQLMEKLCVGTGDDDSSIAEFKKLVSKTLGKHRNLLQAI